MNTETNEGVDIIEGGGEGVEAGGDC